MTRPRGFTLVEIVLVLALTAVLAAGGAATVRRLLPKLQLQAGTWHVTAGLNQARFQAVLSGAPCRVRFVPPGFLLERYDEASEAWRAARIVPLPGVAVAANNAPVFHPQGTVSDLATIVVSNGRGGYKITIAITGRIRTVRTG